ncbi:MAG: RHS repeat domain-containing protein, partial [Actinomycetota bacterium]
TGPGPGDVALEWLGGGPPFRVFRSVDPQTVLDPGNEIGQTTGRGFVDSPPAAPILFYRIGSALPWASSWSHTVGDPLLGGEQEAGCEVCAGCPDPTPGPVRIGPVLVHSGEVVLPLLLPSGSIPGKGAEDWGMPLLYRSQIEFPGCVGHGWNLKYVTDRLHLGTGSVDPADPLEPGIVRYLGGAGRFDFFGSSSGTARGFFQRFEMSPVGFVTVRDRYGYLTRYHDFLGMPTDGALARMEDANDNFLEFNHDAAGRLVGAVDSMGRLIEYLYDPSGRLAAIRDYVGRETTFEYDPATSDLIAVTSPAVIGTPNSDDGIAANGPFGNDFLNGKRYEFVYDAANPLPQLRHNLLAIRFPNAVATGGPPRVTFEYGTDPTDPL